MGKWQKAKMPSQTGKPTKTTNEVQPKREQNGALHPGSNSRTNSGLHRNTLFPKVAYTPGLSGYVCDMYRGYGIIQGVRGVRNQRQQEEQNVRQPARVALNTSTAVFIAAAATVLCTEVL